MSLFISCLEGYSISNSLNTKLKSVFKTICIEENLSQISINLRIINDKEMTELNRKFRNKVFKHKKEKDLLIQNNKKWLLNNVHSMDLKCISRYKNLLFKFET